MLRILEVGIGLALVFTLVALICSIVNEWISAMVEKRGNLLWEGIEKLVDGQLRDDICNHQLMQGLVRKQNWFDATLKRLLPRIDRSKPSYVPTKMFVAALLDVVGARAAGGDPKAIGNLPTTFGDLQTAIRDAKDVPNNVKQALLALVNDAHDIEKAKKLIGDWFDAGMDRVTGWYKRWSQIVLLLVSLGVALVLGVDSIAIAKRLWTDPILRDKVADAAEDFIEENQENQRLRPAAASAGDSTVAQEETLTSDAPLISDSLTSDSGLTSDVPLTSDQTLTSDSTAAGDAPPATNATPAETLTAEELAEKKLEEIQVFQSKLEELTLPLFPPTGLRQEYEQGHPEIAQSEKSKISPFRMFGWWLWQHLLGFVLTTVAASLGAPFWFDVLNRFVNLRNTGKKPAEPAPAKP